MLVTLNNKIQQNLCIFVNINEIEYKSKLHVNKEKSNLTHSK